MATVKKLSRLFRALSDQSLASAAKVAEEIVAEEEVKGHRVAAKVLRGSLRPNGRAFSANTSCAAPAIVSTILPHALVRLRRPIRLVEIQLSAKAKGELRDIQLEWKHGPVLDAAGLGRRTKLAFYGPPGCGKSVTALALGNELALPTYLVRFDAVIGSFLGQTAIHLRELFQFASSTPCILLFDEIDALARRRGNPTDVGELDRIVIAFMQELEHSNPKGMIIATSNLPKHLDDAVWRRFDAAVQFRKPTPGDLRKFIERLARSMGVKLDRRTKNSAQSAISYADAEAIIRSAARLQLLRQYEGLNGAISL